MVKLSLFSKGFFDKRKNEIYQKASAQLPAKT